MAMPRCSHQQVRSMVSLAQRRYNKKTRWTTPTQSLVDAMPSSVREMDNASLITLSAMDDHEASCEMLIRHIMTKDRVTYAKAREKFHEIQAYHKQGLSLFLLPYQLGIVAALTAGFASIPLCFHLDSVQYFNHHFVTTQVPEPEDLETFLEVGSWAWNWMEPPLGQISFFLLCLQFSRYAF